MIKTLAVSTIVATLATASFASETGSLTAEQVDQLIALHAVDLADAEKLREIAATQVSFTTSESADLQRILDKASES
ncbi:hypothetical protein [Yoonia sp. SS1-5]|uniref:Uncharacterized protein n=1 Tax=Yoonia rhodophyticola TaxID=3137370 RepID=A0AAN0NJE2_9RHOB